MNTTHLAIGRANIVKPVKAIDSAADAPLLLNYIPQHKYDGMRIIHHEGNSYSRAGNRVPNAEAEVINQLGYLGANTRDLTFDMEIMGMDKATGTLLTAEQTAGILHRHEPIPSVIGLSIVVFDAIGKTSFVRGTWSRHYIDRLKLIPPEVQPELLDTTGAPTDSAANLLSWYGDILCENPQLEGLVLRQPNAPWNTARNWQAVKVLRPNPPIDLVITAVHSGMGKRLGTAGYITCDYNGSPLKVDLGKGWDDKRRQRMYDNINDYVGLTIEVHYKERSTHGVLRQPKAGRIRFDKHRGMT